MKTNLCLFLLASSLFFGTRVFAESVEKKSPWSTTFTTWSATHYYGSIVGGLFYTGGAMNFTDVMFSRTDTSGLTYMDVSVGHPLDRLKHNAKDGGEEYDFTLGRKFQIGEVSVDVGVVYLIIGGSSSIKDDVAQSYLMFSLPKAPLFQPYVKLFRFEGVGRGTIVDTGWFVYSGLVHNQNLGANFRGKPLVVGFDLRTGYTPDGVFGTKAGIAYYRLDVSLPLNCGKGWTVIPALVGQIKGNQPVGHAFVDRARLFVSLTATKAL